VTPFALQSDSAIRSSVSRAAAAMGWEAGQDVSRTEARAKVPQKVTPWKNDLAESKPFIEIFARHRVTPCEAIPDPLARPTLAIAHAPSFSASPLHTHSATFPRTSPSGSSSPQYLPIDFPVLSGYKVSTSCCPAANGTLRGPQKEVGVVGLTHIPGAD
jgi:hypothetical protein